MPSCGCGDCHDTTANPPYKALHLLYEFAILSLISHAKTVENVTLTTEQEALLSSLHHLIWLDERAKHIEETQQLVSVKLESLQSTHRARMHLIQERMEAAEDDKIKRMRIGELNNKVSEYERIKDRLIAQGRGAELLTSLVVTGIIKVV